MTSESKLTRPSGFPKAHLPLTRVGQATVRRLALHAICRSRTADRTPLSAWRFRSSCEAPLPLVGFPFRFSRTFDRYCVNYEGYCARTARGQSGKKGISETFTQFRGTLCTDFPTSDIHINQITASFPQPEFERIIELDKTNINSSLAPSHLVREERPDRCRRD